MGKSFFLRLFLRFMALLTSLFVLIFIFEKKQWDFLIQDRLYNIDQIKWVLTSDDLWQMALFYFGLKWLIILMAAVIFLVLLFPKLWPFWRPYRKELLKVFLALTIIPGVVAILKKLTDMHCPCDLIHYEGLMLYRSFGKSLMVKQALGECFPAGHASGGLALMILFYLFKRRRDRLLGALVGVTTGAVMGIYQILKGAHFLSHTLASFLIAYFFVAVINDVVESNQIKDRCEF